MGLLRYISVCMVAITLMGCEQEDKPHFREFLENWVAR